MKLATAVRLGRVSNLPTTWSNVLAGLVLAGGAWSAELALGLAIAISSLYVGGMYLNDAFDREIDARERPERPIPAGEVSANAVFGIGFALLAVGVALVAALAFLRDDGLGIAPTLSALALAGVIVFYDMHHKGNPWSPLLMACTRALVYVTAGYSVQRDPSTALWIGALLLLVYLMGLTYVAKQERGRRDVRRLVTNLIAGISLLDAALVASSGHFSAALLCVACCGATLFLQRYVAGT